MFCYLRTSDWQISKVFDFVDWETMGLLHAAQVDAIIKLGEIASERELTHLQRNITLFLSIVAYLFCLTRN